MPTGQTPKAANSIHLLWCLILGGVCMPRLLTETCRHQANVVIKTIKKCMPVSCIKTLASNEVSQPTHNTSGSRSMLMFLPYP